VDVEAVGAKRLVERHRELERAKELPAERGAEELDRAAAGGLRPVHRGVGVPEEALGVRVALGEGDPERAGQVPLAFAEREWFGEHGEDALGYGGKSVLRGDSLDDERELVAAQPGDRFRLAESRPQPVAELDEQLVAGAVPERVVDELEVVDVEEQHRNPGPGAVVAGECLGDPVEEQRPVGKPGEWIVERVVAELDLQETASCDIPDEAVEMRG
jgi:hypothetical protein